jgi:hypothetical protein
VVSNPYSGKTHTMFGPPGCLTEAAVQLAGGGSGSIPESWVGLCTSVLFYYNLFLLLLNCVSNDTPRVVASSSGCTS